MNRKDLIIVGILGMLAMIQASFMPHLPLDLKLPPWVNLVNLAVVIIALFEKRKNNMGWVAAFWGGIFLDMYSGGFLGYWILILIGGVAFIKLILKKYVRIPSFW